MSDKYVLGVSSRKEMGKGFNRRCHQRGEVPGVFYNTKGVNVPVVLSSRELQKLCEQVGNTQVFTLEIDDNGQKSSHETMLWKLERHPFIKRFQHVDFLGIDPSKEIKIKIPLEFVGTSKGVKLGGKLEVYRKHVTLAAKPYDMPAKLTIDITDMDVADMLHANDMALPPNTRRVDEGNFALVTVLRTRAVEDEAGA